MSTCTCASTHATKRVVLTGGPGAGKTAVLELVRQTCCSHVRVLPEAASVLFSGGFPRNGHRAVLEAAQRAIYYVERELERTLDGQNPAIVLCDRGTIDSLAYWPGAPEEFWSSLGTSMDRELSRYDVVIHMRTPAIDAGYNRQNPMRVESAAMAAEIDARIATAWQHHPRRFVVDASASFLDKAEQVLVVLRREIPDCCKGSSVIRTSKPIAEEVSGEL
jgi:predicted ATPase